MIGFLFSLGYFVAGLNWIGNALLVEGNEFRWVWPLAVIALPMLLSLFTALYLTLSFIFFKNKSILSFFGFCFFLFLSEWVRGHVFTGFPWNLYGYGWISILEVAQITSVIGSYGLTFLTIFWGSVIALAIINKEAYLVFIVALLSLSLSYLWGVNRLKDNPTQFDDNVTFQIVQPNIEQSAKWDPEKLVENFETLVLLSKVENPQGKNIIVWPETALAPNFLDSPAVHQRIRSILDENTILLTGVLEARTLQNKRHIQYYNGLMVWYHDKAPQRIYDKSHLVPFGEYIPFQQYIPLRPVVAFTGFERGNGTEIIQIEDFPTFTPKICYEIIFPDEMINHKKRRPDFILTVTNDGWYGNSPGPHQHFTQTRFRAIENKIPVIRSANTGVSGVIDGHGRVVDKTDLMQKASISSKFPQ